MDKQIEIKDAFQMIRISLTDRQAEQLLNYYDLLIKKNKVMNLTAITEF